MPDVKNKQHIGCTQPRAQGVPLTKLPTYQTLPSFLSNSSSFSEGQKVARCLVLWGRPHSTKGLRLLPAALGEKAHPGSPPRSSLCLSLSLSPSPRLSSSCSWFKPLPAPANNALSRSDRIMVSHWFHMSQIIAFLAHHIEVVRTLLRL